ncbi:hypothetical protein CPB84DRAFT_1784763 [Gymnopilus junonius]|uniref:Uncharacterized protein n=1 Tax=Gymnopilus junonius TaxID=109634 RepID=A0A9P5NIP7_GYMJU|nr:hypothetical protein CPB84DRAFT_1784763 [Gymnopilus junonius]
MEMQVYQKPELSKKMAVVHNSLVSTKEIAELLWTNQVTIDVDNDYEVICFDKSSFESHWTALLKQFIQLKTTQSLDDEYLRAHFRHSLLVNIVGGGIFDDFKQTTVGMFVKQHIEEIEWKAFRGTVWQYGIGKLVREWVMNESIDEAFEGSNEDTS